jgi:signal transduction histidine kinase
LLPLIVASTTDGLLPLFGVQWPRLGTLSIAALGTALLWPLHRFGSVLLARGTFTAEMLQMLPDGVATLGFDGRIRSANATLAKLLEARPHQLVGLPLTDRLSEPLHPMDDGLERQCEVRTLAGRPLPVAISSRVLRDREGSGIGLLLVVRDLREVVALRDRLLLSGRLAAVGELAAGVAHEINNPLAFVRANLGLLREHWAGVAGALEKAGAAEQVGALISEGEDLVEESLEGVDRAVAIVRDVRGLAHAGDGRRHAADLNELLRGVLRMAAPQLRGRAEVEERLGDLPFVWGSPPELQQVFLNLVINAAQALDGHGRIVVSSARQGRFVVASVEDDGCGIDPEVRDRIFDPFFTTKPVGEGSGLGLGIAYGIVRSHGGDIDVDSQVGVGTRISVHLPVATDTLDSG